MLGVHSHEHRRNASGPGAVGYQVASSRTRSESRSGCGILDLAAVDRAADGPPPRRRLHAQRPGLWPDRRGGESATGQTDLHHQPGGARQHPAQPEPAARDRVRFSRSTATSTDSGAACWLRPSTARASRTTSTSSKKKRCARSPAGRRVRRSPRCRRRCGSRSTRSCARSSGPKAPSLTSCARSSRRGSPWARGWRYCPSPIGPMGATLRGAGWLSTGAGTTPSSTSSSKRSGRTRISRNAPMCWR